MLAAFLQLFITTFERLKSLMLVLEFKPVTDDVANVAVHLRLFQSRIEVKLP